MPNISPQSQKIPSPESIFSSMESALGLAKTKNAIEVCSQLGYQMLDEHFGANSLSAAPFNTRWTQAVSRKVLETSK